MANRAMVPSLATPRRDPTRTEHVGLALLTAAIEPVPSEYSRAHIAERARLHDPGEPRHGLRKREGTGGAVSNGVIGATSRMAPSERWSTRRS